MKKFLGLVLGASCLLMCQPNNASAATISDEKDPNITYQQKNIPLTTNTFINSLIPDILKLSSRYDIYPSVTMAQASLESGFGTSGLSQAPYNNLFGIKGLYNNQGKVFKTSEENNEGYYQVSSMFKQYPSVYESLEDYCLLLTNGLTENQNYYQGALRSNASSYKEATAFLTGRYATDTHYAEKLNQIIESYDLTRYDEIVEGVSAGTSKHTSYRIKYGDTLEAISKTYKETIDDIVTANHQVSDPNLIYAGDTLILSDKTIKTTDQKLASSYEWPLKTTFNISSEFGQRDDPTGNSGTQHNGIDLAVASGTPVYAAHSGTVVEAGYDPSAGNYVIIKDKQLYSYYMHLSSYDVTVNQNINTSQEIGKVGSTGNSTGPHLHFGISNALWKEFKNPRDVLIN